MSPCRGIQKGKCEARDSYRFSSSINSDTSSISLSKIASEVSICKTEDVEKRRRVHPAYATYTAPGPNKYKLKSCTGFKDHDPTKIVMPAYSFQREARFRDPPKPPEPLFEIEEPQKTIECFKCCTIPKTVKIEKYPDYPAPNIYKVDKCYKSIEKQGPKYTFGYRWDEKLDRTPGPGQYCINCPKKYSNCFDGFTMGIRDQHNSYLRDISQTPAMGPVDYSSVLRTGPSYSIGVILKPLVSSKTPGPNTYHPECSTGNKKKFPQYSFGVKHSKYKITPIILH